jgi:hypothetical protein
LRKLLVFSPLVVFAGYAVYQLASHARPFFLRWIDLSMAFTLALVATFILKKILLDDDADGDDRGHP